MKFNSVIHGIPNVLSPLFSSYGIKPTYLLSPEVIRDKESRSTLASVKGAELGTHLHGEFIDPHAEYDCDRTKIPQFEYGYEIEKEKLLGLTSLFTESFGRKPLSFRAGRWGISSHTLRILQDLEYQVDSSVAPFSNQVFANSRINFWGAPVQPYYPSYKNFRRKGKMSILEVPATCLVPGLLNFPSQLISPFNEKNRLHRRILRRFGVIPKPIWLRPFKSSSEEIRRGIESLVQARRNDPFIVLNMMFHSNEIEIGGSPYVSDEGDLENYRTSLVEIFDFLKDRFQFDGITLSDTKEL